MLHQLYGAWTILPVMRLLTLNNARDQWPVGRIVSFCRARCNSFIGSFYNEAPRSCLKLTLVTRSQHNMHDEVLLRTMLLDQSAFCLLQRHSLVNMPYRFTNIQRRCARIVFRHSNCPARIFVLKKALPIGVPTRFQSNQWLAPGPSQPWCLGEHSQAGSWSLPC